MFMSRVLTGCLTINGTTKSNPEDRGANTQSPKSLRQRGTERQRRAQASLAAQKRSLGCNYSVCLVVCNRDQVYTMNTRVTIAVHPDVRSHRGKCRIFCFRLPSPRSSKPSSTTLTTPHTLLNDNWAVHTSSHPNTDSVVATLLILLAVVAHTTPPFEALCF